MTYLEQQAAARKTATPRRGRLPAEVARIREAWADTEVSRADLMARFGITAKEWAAWTAEWGRRPARVLLSTRRHAAPPWVDR